MPLPSLICVSVSFRRMAWCLHVSCLRLLSSQPPPYSCPLPPPVHPTSPPELTHLPFQSPAQAAALIAACNLSQFMDRHIRCEIARAFRTLLVSWTPMMAQTEPQSAQIGGEQGQDARGKALRLRRCRGTRCVALLLLCSVPRTLLFYFWSLPTSTCCSCTLFILPFVFAFVTCPHERIFNSPLFSLDTSKSHTAQTQCRPTPCRCRTTVPHALTTPFRATAYFCRKVSRKVKLRFVGEFSP